MESDKVFLPPSALRELSDLEGVEHPYQFEIRSQERGTRTYVGVLEFSAPEGQILLPDKVREDLDLPMEELAGGGTVSLCYVALPKVSQQLCCIMTTSNLGG